MSRKIDKKGNYGIFTVNDNLNEAVEKIYQTLSQKQGL